MVVLPENYTLGIFFLAASENEVYSAWTTLNSIPDRVLSSVILIQSLNVPASRMKYVLDFP